MKFEDWSHEETERQQRCARQGLDLAKNIFKLKQKENKATLNSLAEEWVLLVAETKEPEER